MEWGFVEILKRLIHNYKEVTEVLEGNIKSTIGQNNGEISLEQYNERGADIEQAIQELTRKRVALEEKSSLNKLAMLRVEQISAALNAPEDIEKFDDELCRSLVDVVVVRNTYTLDFYLKCGITESITITR